VCSSDLEDMKKRGLASPDLADALAMTFARPVTPAHDRCDRPRFAKTDFDPFNPYGR